LQDDLDAGQSIDESPWRAIRATKFEGTERAAQIRTWTINLPTGRSVLNEREVVGVVKKAFDLGLTKEEVVAQIGRHSRKLVHDIDLIMNADSSVIESVLAGTLSILGGAYIAAEVPLDKQEEAVADYEAALEEAGGDHEAARANSGNKKSRTKPLKLPEIRELLWPDWINWQRMMENALVIDPTTMVRVGTLLRVLQMPVKDGYPFPGDTDETYLPYEDVVKALDPHYAISENEKNGTSEKKEKKTRISRKQREAAERAATTAPQAAHYDLDDE
ncbi:MAG: hypothetical protein EBR81_15740, partial [Proteobacteria bacterium]|nr:hypothetical protein [Pseudomonadota bacterium]